MGQILTTKSLIATSELPRSSGTSLSAGDVLGASVAVSGATTAGVLTCYSHGLTVGQFYRGTSASIGGMTGLDGNYAFLPTDANTIQIYQQDEVTKVTGTGTYTSGGTIALLHKFKNLINVAGGKGILIKTRISVETNAIFSGTLTLFLYKSQVTATLDDAVKAQLYANNLSRIGFITLIPRPYFPSGSTCVQLLEDKQAHELFSDTHDIFGELVTDSAITLQASKKIFIELISEVRQ